MATEAMSRGLASPLVTLLACVGAFMMIGPLSTGAEFLVIWAVAALSGLSLAVGSYAPWLGTTSRIGPASPERRWAMLRATASMGFAGSGIFGLAYVALGVWDGVRAGRWGLASLLTTGVFNGFLIGVLFALVLSWVYRRVAVNRLTALKVGAWGAAAAAVPAVVLVTLRTFVWDVELQLPHPLVELTRVFFVLCLPGFLLAYGAVKMAQRSDE